MFPFLLDAEGGDWLMFPFSSMICADGKKPGKNIEIMESAVIFQEGHGSYARDDSGRLEIERLCRDLRAGEGSERILF